MKKLGIAFIMALLALAFVAVPAFAYDPDVAYSEATCDEPGVESDSDTLHVGDTVLFYGTVSLKSYTRNYKDYCTTYDGTYKYDMGAYVIIKASGELIVNDPNGDPVVLTGDDYYFDYDSGYIIGESHGYNGCNDQNVSTWIGDNLYLGDSWDLEASVTLTVAGEYTALCLGDAYAEYGYWVQKYEWVPGECPCCGGSWEAVGDLEFVAEGDPAYDELYSGYACCQSQKTFTCLGGQAALSTGRTRPILTVLTSEDSEVYFPSEGWGDPTTDYIVYNDGTWQVEIADGTRILLDGEWHRKTWIEVDDQGNVIGKYGSGGHIIAEEIALSSPITITKVG